MKSYFQLFCLVLTLTTVLSCKTEKPKPKKPVINNPNDLREWILNETLKDFDRNTFGYDLKFIRQRKTPLLLYDQEFKNMVLVSHEFQGRVLTSSADGLNGYSFGWMNYDLIASGELQDHMNAFGGEDRIWLGPEGGQYSLYFKPKAEFKYENWQVPNAFDSEAFEIISVSSEEVSLFKRLNLTNYANTPMDIVLSRQIKLESPAAFLYKYGVIFNDKVKAVGFSSLNVLRNQGTNEWNQQTGMPSIWILGMFKPSPTATVVLPYKPGPENAMGKVVNDDYFGSIPPDRLIIDPNVIYFKADGRQRGKIGTNTYRARPTAGYFDEERGVLTIVEYTLPETPAFYVNSQWKIQEKPFAGDVVNAYNDGPLENGTQMGPFFEIESSSPAAALKNGETLQHKHATYHFMGDDAALNDIAVKILGVSISEIRNAFK